MLSLGVVDQFVEFELRLFLLVFLCKLMYTEYPIFPNGKVHIPTTPNYNRRLKTTLEIFLNEGGTIKQIEGRI